MATPLFLLDLLGTFLHVGAEEALAAADKVDEQVKNGEEPASALAGVLVLCAGVLWRVLRLHRTAPRSTGPRRGGDGELRR